MSRGLGRVWIQTMNLSNAFSAKDYFEEQYVLRKSLPTFMEHVAEWEILSTDDKTDDFKRQSILGALRLNKTGRQNISFVPTANHLTLMTKFATNRSFASGIIGNLEQFSRQ